MNYTKENNPIFKNITFVELTRDKPPTQILKNSSQIKVPKGSSLLNAGHAEALSRKFPLRYKNVHLVESNNPSNSKPNVLVVVDVNRLAAFCKNSPDTTKIAILALSEQLKNDVSAASMARMMLKAGQKKDEATIQHGYQATYLRKKRDAQKNTAALNLLLKEGGSRFLSIAPNSSLTINVKKHLRASDKLLRS